MRKKLLTILFATLLSTALLLGASGKAFAKTKSYGFTDAGNTYMYSQGSDWWDLGDKSEKNGSAINAFAAAMSLLYEKRITPAAVAKIAKESNLWDLSGATPEDLISSLTTNSAFGGKVLVKAAGKNTSARLTALANSFVKTDNKSTVVIARATGKNPFHNSEAGGHYILILAYKSDGTCLVYDPAQSSSSPKWGKAKTLLNQMSSDIMFWAISKGSGTTAEDLDFYQGIKDTGEPASEEPTPSEPEGDCWDENDNWLCGDDSGEDSEEEHEPEGDCWDENDNWLCGGEDGSDNGDTPTVDCTTDPSNEVCGDGNSPKDSGRGGAGTSGTNRTARADTIADNAVLSAWPVIQQNGRGICYNSAGVKYWWNTGVGDYHNRQSCGNNIRNEYREMLNNIGVKANATDETWEIKNYLMAVFKASDYKVSDLSSLKSKNLLDWIKGNSVVVSELMYGDIIHNNGTYYIYIGDKGGDYGNIITTSAGVEGPHIDYLDTNTQGLVIYRLVDGEKTTPEDPGSGGGETPTPIQQPTQPDPENKKATKLAEIARNVAWPAINNSGTAYCYNENNVAQSAYTVIDCYHYLKKEYKSAMESSNNSASQNDLELESFDAASARMLKTVLATATLSGDQAYVESEAKKDNGEWKKVTGSLTKGDLVKRSGINSLYIYIGDLGGTYGNFVGMNENGGLNPYVWNFSETDKIEVIYRLKNDSAEPTTPSDPTTPTDPVTPPPSGEGIGDEVAKKAMSFSWPYTQYSTDNSSVYGKCVKKYNGSKTKYSKFPKEDAGKGDLSKYPTGTSCNKVLPAAYADYVGKTTNSARNSANVSAISFVKNVYKSLGINIPYFNIADIRNNLGSSSQWKLITTAADTNTTLLPGDLLVGSDYAGVYVGDYGEGYGKVAQAYYKKWTPRLTPIYYKNTYVFRLKSNTVITDGIGCEALNSASASGNNKIAIEATNMSWPILTGSADSIGKCEAKGAYTKFPTAYTYSYSNTTITGKLKSQSDLSKARSKTGCNKTYTNEFDDAAKKYLSTYNTMATFTYAVMKSAGVNYFEPDTKNTDLKIETIFNNLKADTEHFEVISKKVKDTNDLKPGDILINVETKKKKTYSDMLIYVGSYGKDCLGIYYGNVAKASSSETPHLQPIYYKINNSSSRSNFWVFRAKDSAYGEVGAPADEDDEDDEEREPEGDCWDENNNWLCGDDDEEEQGEDQGGDGEQTGSQEPAEKTCSDDPTQEKCLEWGPKIAAQAMKFAWPYTKYSLEELGINGTNYTNAMGKCVNVENTLKAWPTPFKGNGYDAQDAKYSAPGCDKMAAPLYARYKGFSDNRSYSTLVTETGIYTSDIKSNYTRKVYNPTWKWDCINFVNDVLGKLGIQKFASSPAGSINYNKTGWMKIGDFVKDTTSARNAYKSSKVLTTNQGIQLQPGDVAVRYDVCFDKSSCDSGTKIINFPADSEHPQGYSEYVLGGHIFIYTGSLSHPYGDRAEGGKNDYVGTIRDTWISDHIYNYGRFQVYRYVGTQQWSL